VQVKLPIDDFGLLPPDYAPGVNADDDPTRSPHGVEGGGSRRCPLLWGALNPFPALSASPVHLPRFRPRAKLRLVNYYCLREYDDDDDDDDDDSKDNNWIILAWGGHNW
jgi:hypothetical protein